MGLGHEGCDFDFIQQVGDPFRALFKKIHVVVLQARDLAPVLASGEGAIS